MIYYLSLFFNFKGDNMKVGIIGGTGPQGLGIGKRLAMAGVDVIIGSRKEDKALQVVEEAKEELKDYELADIVGMANEDAAKSADILIMTVPLQAQIPTLKTIKEFCHDKIFLDATVPLETALIYCTVILVQQLKELQVL